MQREAVAILAPPGLALVLLSNIWLDRKNLPTTNALAYCHRMSEDEKKVYWPGHEIVLFNHDITSFMESVLKMRLRSVVFPELGPTLENFNRRIKKLNRNITMLNVFDLNSGLVSTWWQFYKTLFSVSNVAKNKLIFSQPSLECVPVSPVVTPLL